jgi:hypothetical protein
MALFECCDASHVAPEDEIQHCPYCGKIVEPKTGYTWWGDSTDQELADVIIYGPGAVVHDWDDIYAGFGY